MSIHAVPQRFNAWRSRMQVWWITIFAFAIVLAYADGFWVTSLQGAVGAIERNEDPFHRWVRDSTLMFPLYVLVVLTAIRMARRVVGQRRGLVKYATTAVLVVVLTTGVAVAEVMASSAYDYHFQTRHLALEHQLMGHTHVATDSATFTESGATACTALCESVRNTFNSHVRAVFYSSVVMLITNLVLVLWVLALRSDRLWRRAATPPPSAAAVAHEELSMA
ncbi:MAG TPA: hypothetical protein VHQ23_09795 [Ilumatobacteraceae bacterium]|nr:hypothetical protein [Ilumatobacteraceae bacterium]